MESGNGCLICGSGKVNTHFGHGGSGSATDSVNVKPQRTSRRKTAGSVAQIGGSGSDSAHVSALCKLLRLSPNCSLRLKHGVGSEGRLFCPDCATSLCTVEQVFEEILRLQKQTENSRTEIESRINQCYQRRKVTRSKKLSVADNLRALIVQDIGNTNASTQTHTAIGLRADDPVEDADDDIGNDPLADSDHGSHIEGDQGQLGQNLEGTNNLPELRLKECMVDLSSVKVEPIEVGVQEGDRKRKKIRPHVTRPVRLQKPRKKRSGSPRPKKIKIQKPKGPFNCSDCPAIFQSESSLQYHYNKNHGLTQFATFCTTCGKRFYAQRSLEKHLEVQGGSCRKEPIPNLVTVPLEHGTMNFKCNLCGLSTRNRRVMLTHAATHTGVKNFICQICGEGLKTQQSLKQHMLSQHPDTTDPSVPHPFACTHPGCGKTMGNAAQFKFHTKKHRNEYDFQCEHCDYKTTYPSSFKTHMDCVHKKLRPYQCVHCAQTFKKSTQMQKHIYSKHTAPEDRPFKCATCGKTFSDKFHLGRHEIIHTGLKPIACKLCNKRFAVDDYLRIHMKTHKQKYSSKKPQAPESDGQSLLSETGSPQEIVPEEEPEVIVDVSTLPSSILVFAHKTCPN